MKTEANLKKHLHLRGLRRHWNVFLVNHVYAGVKPRYFEKKRKLLNQIGCRIGQGTKIVGPVFFYQPFSVGENCWIGKNLTINGDGAVEIGNNCDIAPEVTLLTGGHEIGDHNRRAGQGQIYTVTVGNGCWIGARSTLVGTVKVEDGAVVAACACVVQDVPADTLVGGVPARAIRQMP